MFALIFFTSLAALGFIGALLIVGRRVLVSRFTPEGEEKLKIEGLPPFFDFMRHGVVRPFEEFVANTVRPAMFKIGEKFLRRFRLLVLRAEAFLHRLSDYFHGKRIAIKKNGNGNGNGKNSGFWNEMSEAQNGLQNGENNKKENKGRNNNLPA